MDFKNFLRNLFYEEIEIEEETKKEIAKDEKPKLETKESTGLPIYSENSHAETVQEKDSAKEDYLGILKNNLESLKMQKISLPLDKIKSETQIVNNIIDDLRQDMKSLKDNEHRKEEFSSVISTRVKNIATRGIQLKGLLGVIESDYYKKLVDSVKDANEKLRKEELSVLVVTLESNLEVLKNLQEVLGDLVVYDYKMNSEKNQNYVNAINEEGGRFVEYLRKLQNELSANILLNGGLNSKIDDEHAIEQTISAMS